VRAMSTLGTVVCGISLGWLVLVGSLASAPEIGAQESEVVVDLRVFSDSPSVLELRSDRDGPA
jgi:hypothetical protein